MGPGPLLTPHWIATLGWPTAEHVEKFQELIGTLVGFAGVMLTLWFNARQERQQHQRQVEHERSAIRAMLLAELKRNSEAFADNIERLTEGPAARSLIVPTKSVVEIYDRLLDRVGFLAPSEVQPVTNAYMMIRAIPDRLSLAIANTEYEPPQVVVDHYIVVPVGLVPIYRHLLVTAKQDVDEAIACLMSGSGRSI